MDEQLENQNQGASVQGKIVLILVILGVAASLYLIMASSRGLFPFSKEIIASPTPVPTPMVTPTPEFCIQVITPARNLLTGEIKDFPTPCDVPDGWIKI